MRFLTNAKSIASSFLTSWKRDEGSFLKVVQPVNLQSVPSLVRGETQRILTIRKREFNTLRALRQNLNVNHKKSTQQYFHTSTLINLSEKKTTIIKIDEIEAQMSMQWWKTNRLDFNRQEDSKK